MQLPSSPALPVETERLTLRRFEPGDLDALVVIQSDPIAVRYVPYGPRRREEVAAALDRKLRSGTLAAQGDLLELAVVERAGGTVIGDILLAVSAAEHQTLDVGYIFATAAGGQGYATEAVRALVALAFDTVGARRVVAHLDERNVRSAALLERLGFRREARLVENEWWKGELTTELVYAQLARERADRSGADPT